MVSTCLDHKERGLIFAVGHASPEAFDCLGQHQRNVILRTEQQKRWSEPTNNWKPGLCSAFTFLRADSVNYLAPSLSLSRQATIRRNIWPHQYHIAVVTVWCFPDTSFAISSKHPVADSSNIHYIPRFLLLSHIPWSRDIIVPCDLNSPLVKNT